MVLDPSRSARNETRRGIACAAFLIPAELSVRLKKSGHHHPMMPVTLVLPLLSECFESPPYDPTTVCVPSTGV
jgi:hypothetical protein